MHQSHRSHTAFTVRGGLGVAPLPEHVDPSGDPARPLHGVCGGGTEHSRR